MGFLTLYFILFLFLILVGLWLTDKLIDKLLGIKKKGKIADTPGKNIDRWGRGIILVVFLFSFPFVISESTTAIQWFWGIYMIILMGFQAFLEWKYLQNSKQYVSTLIFLMIFLVFLYIIENLFKLLV